MNAVLGYDGHFFEPLRGVTNDARVVSQTSNKPPSLNTYTHTHTYIHTNTHTHREEKKHHIRTTQHYKTIKL